MISPRATYGAGALLTILFASSVAHAGPTVLSTRPTVGETGRIQFLAGGIDERGRSLRNAGLEVDLDGQPATPVTAQSLSDWAAGAAESSQTWRPPLSVGVVYLWVTGVPADMLDGIHAFFQRLPPRTTVYPTIYGRLRQGRARLTAGDIGRLDEVPYLDGYRPNLIDAIRMNLADLASDPASLKILLVVTDGRDYADPKGQGPGDFTALGAELRRSGITLLITRFRAEADAEQIAGNLRDLSDASGGFLESHDQPEELENTLESLGQSVADLQRLELAVPWTWRLIPSSHRITTHFTAPNGERLSTDAGTVSIGPATSALVMAGVVLVAVVILLVWLIVRVRRQASADSDPHASVEEVLLMAHNLIRRGASPDRAAEELGRAYPDAGPLLEEVDERLLTDRRFPYLRTRPGRKRLQEIRTILGARRADGPHLPGGLARILADVVASGVPAPTAAERLTALTSSEERAAFAALDLEALAAALTVAAATFAVLGTPRARGLVVAIQDALRASEARSSGVSVGWLVRTGGPGKRGETLRLGAERTVIGRDSGCDIQLVADPAIGSAHSAISHKEGEYFLEPIGGAVRVEGETVKGERLLVDGETLEMGGGFYVFKVASLLHLKAARSIGRGGGRS